MAVRSLATSLLRGLAAARLPTQVCSSSSSSILVQQQLPALSAAAALLRRHYAAQPLAAVEEEAAAAQPPVPIEALAEQGRYQDLLVPVYNLNKEQVGSMVLGGDVFDVPVRKDILHRVVRWQLARRQQGTHKTKTRSEVRGGGRKPRPQKGSGNSRQGSIRSPQWRGGGVAHGPVLRSHEFQLFKRVRRLGIKCALSAKAWEGRLIVVDSLKPAEPKTKLMSEHIDALLAGAPRRSLLMVDSDKQGEDGGEDLRRAAGNLPWVNIVPARGVNVYSMLQRDYLVMSRGAVEAVLERLRRPIKPCSFTP